MLRIRQNLRPRVPNSFAAFSAILLLVSSLVGMNNAIPANDRSSNLIEISQSELGTETQDVSQAVTRQGIKISLMIFRHR